MILSDERSSFGTVFLVALMAWLYWESMNLTLFDWWPIDGYPTYVAAKLWLSAQPDAIYHAQLWIPDWGHPGWRRMMAQNGISNSGTSYVYHPLYLFVVAQFAASLTLEQFSYLILLVNALSVGLIAVESVRLAGASDTQRQTVALVFVCISFPGLYSAFLGQNILSTLALILIGQRCLEHQQKAIGSVLLTVAASMKIWVLPAVLLILVMHGRKAVMVGFTCMGIGLVLLPLVVDAELFSNYLAIAAQLTKITVYPYNNVAVRAFLERISNPEWVAAIYTWMPHRVSGHTRWLESVFLSLVIATSVALWWRRQPPRSFVFAGILSLVLLLPGVCWTHYFVFALPAATMLWLRGSRWRAFTGLAALMMFAIPWHPSPGSVLPRALFGELVATHPEPLVWGLLIPPLVAAILAFSALSFQPNLPVVKRSSHS